MSLCRNLMAKRDPNAAGFFRNQVLEAVLVVETLKATISKRSYTQYQQFA